QIDFLLKTKIAYKIKIIRIIIRHHGDRRSVKAINQQTTTVVGREIDRPHNIVAAFGTHPMNGSREQLISYFLIIDTIKETELSFCDIIEVVMSDIPDSSYTPYNFTVPVRKKRLCCRMLIKRML